MPTPPAARSTLEATVLAAAATPEGVTAATLRTAAAETRAVDAAEEQTLVAERAARRADRAHRDTDPPGEPTPLGELVLAARAEVVEADRAKTRYAVEALRARLDLAERVIGELMGAIEIALDADAVADWQDAEGDGLHSVYRRLRAEWEAGCDT